MGYILKGYIEVPMEEVENIKKYLSRHIQNTLEESGCLEFRVEQDSADKSVFDVITKFVVVEMEVVDLVKHITKYAVLLKDKNQIRYELEKMLHFSKEGRPGPVLMDLPDDLQRADVNPKKLKGFKPPKIKTNKIKFEKKFINLIKNSKRPLIILGHLSAVANVSASNM